MYNEIGIWNGKLIYRLRFGAEKDETNMELMKLTHPSTNLMMEFYAT